MAAKTTTTTTTNGPCGACKFLRRKCTPSCIFAAHFSSDQGPTKFAAVHKVFGASNVSKVLMNMSPVQRHDAVTTICYEAQARMADPILGCVSTVLFLQKQVAAFQAELNMVQSQLMNTRLAVANALQTPPYPINNNDVLNPTFSGVSVVSNDLLNNNCGDNQSLNFVDCVLAPPSEGSEHQRTSPIEPKCEEEESSGGTAFVDEILTISKSC